MMRRREQVWRRLLACAFAAAAVGHDPPSAAAALQSNGAALPSTPSPPALPATTAALSCVAARYARLKTDDDPRVVQSGTCGCVPASLCRALQPQPPPHQAERLIFTSRYYGQSADDHGRIWDYVPWGSANITTVINMGGADFNRLACESHRHGARAILAASSLAGVAGSPRLAVSQHAFFISVIFDRKCRIYPLFLHLNEEIK